MVSSAVSRAGPVSRQAVVAANLPAHRRGCPAEARRNGAQGHAGGQSTGDLLPLDQVQRPRPTPPRSWPRPTARQLQGPDGAGEAAERRRHRGCRFASSEPVPDLSPFCFGEPSSSSHDTSRGQRSSLLARGVASTDGLQDRSSCQPSPEGLSRISRSPFVKDQPWIQGVRAPSLSEQQAAAAMRRCHERSQVHRTRAG